jgi:hypothetical protein
MIDLHMVRTFSIAVYIYISYINLNDFVHFSLHYPKRDGESEQFRTVSMEQHCDLYRYLLLLG